MEDIKELNELMGKYNDINKQIVTLHRSFPFIKPEEVKAKLKKLYDANASMRGQILLLFKRQTIYRYTNC